jgi:hypothetical protein
VCEGSEEMSTGGLEQLVRSDPSLFAADVMLIADAECWTECRHSAEEPSPTRCGHDLS